MHVSPSPIVPSARLRTVTAELVRRHLADQLRRARRSYLQLYFQSSALVIGRWALIILGILGLASAVSFATDSPHRSAAALMIGGCCLAAAMLIHPEDLIDAAEQAQQVAAGIDELRRQSTLLREWNRRDAPCMLWRERDGVVLALARPKPGQERYAVKCVILPHDGVPAEEWQAFEAAWNYDSLPSVASQGETADLVEA